MVDNSPSFQKDQVCETVFATLAAEIGAFGTNVNLRVKEAERIAIEDKNAGQSNLLSSHL